MNCSKVALPAASGICETAHGFRVRVYAEQVQLGLYVRSTIISSFVLRCSRGLLCTHGGVRIGSDLGRTTESAGESTC
jgi:hypothetical protein